MKKRTGIAAIIMILVSLSSACSRSEKSGDRSSTQTAVAEAETAATAYKIGDKGPADGIIFYDKGNDQGDWRYLEAAPHQYDFMTEWGLDEEEMSLTSEEIGSGKRNTEAIVAALVKNGENGKAAQYCNDLTVGRYDDWFLPSWKELSLMHDNLFKKNLGEFKTSDYWSSTHTNGGFGALNMAFYENYGAGYSRSQKMWVRAVRAFSIEKQSSPGVESIDEYPREMYVNAFDGLRVRKTPGLSSERTGLLPPLAVITVIGEDDDIVTIDDIRGKWVLMKFLTQRAIAYGSGSLEGWVFNGYLTDCTYDSYHDYLKTINFEKYFQADTIQRVIGNWAPAIGGNSTIYRFQPDGDYSSALLETSYGTGGTWQAKDGSLYLSQTGSGDQETRVHNPPLSYEYKFVIIGNNTLLLRSVNHGDSATQVFHRYGGS